MTYYFGPVRDYAHAARLQERFEGNLPTRDLSDLALNYCVARLAYSAGADEAGDAAFGCLLSEIDGDERDQIEAQLYYDYPNRAAWIACIANEADYQARQAMMHKAKRAVVLFIQQVAA